MACSIPLFDSLTGTPDTGGTWTATTGNYPGSINGGYLGVIDPSNVVAGTYVFQYNVGTAPCDSQSNVTVTINDGVDSGVENTVSICFVSSTPINLFNLLGGGNVSTDGVWSGPLTSDPGYNFNGDVTASTFTASDSAGAGTYSITYTVDHSASNTPTSCTDCTDSSTLTITVEPPVEAGDDTSLINCLN